MSTKTDFTMERIGQVLGILQHCTVTENIRLHGWQYCECDYKHDNVFPAAEQMREFGKDEHWGAPADAHAWFHRVVEIPSDWCEKGEVRLRISTGRGGWNADNPQFIAYLNGVMVQGLDVNHTELYLPQDADQVTVDLYAYVGSHACPTEFRAELLCVCTECEQLYYDLRVPKEILDFSDPKSKAYADVLHILNQAMNCMDCREVGSPAFLQGVQAAREYLKQYLFEGYCKEQPQTTVCIGHTHIDVAWMWTLEQTREKVQRSFSTVLALMKRYPEYKFMSSQAQLYQYLKQEAPEVYEEIKEMVRQGRWEVEGAMWVEADCNLSSGESLVRQVLFGKRFFKQEFDVDSRVLWLPDVFGYSAALPQILRKSGVDRFVTSKISWNETNQMPYDMFRWKGLDGTEIFSYFLTAQEKRRGQEPVNHTTYVSFNTPEMIAGAWDRFQQKEFSDQALNTFGHGDGGGGPTAEMLEMRRRMHNGFGECPNARIGTATEFLNHIATAEHDPKLPVWSGELYLEFHRGTYTSIARNKRNNRKSEFAYQQAEFLSSLNRQLTGGAYDQKTLNDGWERILLYQFHDIIPGSSIKPVYDDCDLVYPKILAAAADLSQTAMDAIADRIETKGGVLVFNPHSFVGNSTVQVDGETRYVQNIPAKGYAVVVPKALDGSVTLQDHAMENHFLRVEFDENYNLKSIYDKKACREVLDPTKGVGNRFEVYEDYPYQFDAWEISNYYTEKMYGMDEVTSVKELRDGARSGYEISRKFMDSTLTQRIWMYEDIGKIDFDTEIDWKQKHLLLKTAFPVAIHSNSATYEVQFGAVERPTHYNTSWDAAKFEVCAHKYCDLSEYGYGVSLLNDCKYGHDIHNGIMRLTLLKSATYPNPDADRCHHEFTYSLVPHSGDYREAGVVQLAYDLNQPMTAKSIAAQQGDLPAQYSMISVDTPNVILETVKKAEDSEDLVLRMYDAYGQSTQAAVTLGFTPRRVVLCDLMENEIQEISFDANTFTLPVKAFEIVTVKVQA